MFRAERGITGQINAHTTEREISPLARKIALEAELKALEATGIHTLPLRTALGLTKTPAAPDSQNKAKPR